MTLACNAAPSCRVHARGPFVSPRNCRRRRDAARRDALYQVYLLLSAVDGRTPRSQMKLWRRTENNAPKHIACDHDVKLFLSFFQSPRCDVLNVKLSKYSSVHSIPPHLVIMFIVAISTLGASKILGFHAFLPSP